jgi:Holliday junction DNA helicase RuvA
MIARLVGELVEDDGDRAILDVRGVGYEVFAPGSALVRWRGAGTITAWVSTRVREDAITLYAFETSTDRAAFEVLTSVSGVGPRLALACLGTLDLKRLASAIEGDDHTALARIPGVGKKTAQRLALELKGKLPVDLTLGPPRAEPRAPEDPLVLALAQLEYGRSEIERALAGLAERGLDRQAPNEVRLKAALALLMGGR